VSRGLIALHFGLPLCDVEDRPITEYRLMLFTVFNSAALQSGMGGFKYQTDDEEYEEFTRLINHYKDIGVFN
jgi:hypothetical protein